MDLTTSLPAFVLAVVLISASPGPAMALILRRAALYGFRGAVPTVLGLELGLYLWALAAGQASLLWSRRPRRPTWCSASSAPVSSCTWGCGLARLADPPGPPSGRTPGGRAAVRPGRRPRGRGPRPGPRLHRGDGRAPRQPQGGGVPDGLLPAVRAGRPAAVHGHRGARPAPGHARDHVLYLGLAAGVARAGAWFRRPRVRQRLEVVSGTVLVALGLRVASSGP